MFSRRYSKMPLIFHINGSGQNERVVTSSNTSASIPSSKITRFSMFQNLQNTKPCGSCGGR